MPRHLLEGKELAKASEFNTKRPVAPGRTASWRRCPGDHYTFEAVPDYFGGQGQDRPGHLQGDPRGQHAGGPAPERRAGLRRDPAHQHAGHPGARNVKLQTVPVPGLRTRLVQLQASPVRRCPGPPGHDHALDRESMLQVDPVGARHAGDGPIPPLFAWAYNDTLKPVPVRPGPRPAAPAGTSGGPRGRTASSPGTASPSSSSSAWTRATPRRRADRAGRPAGVPEPRHEGEPQGGGVAGLREEAPVQDHGGRRRLLGPAARSGTDQLLRARTSPSTR